MPLYSSSIHSLVLRPMALLAVLCCTHAAQAAGPTGLLNDTGQITCDDGANTLATCNSTSTQPPGQDGHLGRDANKQLVKSGGGAAGFDFTKICMDGTPNCTAAADTGANPAATAWACTKDNRTNLIWSLESQQGDARSGYTTSRCGFSSGWRLPTRRELLGIVHNGKEFPSIDSTYFPNTSANAYWSSESHILDGSNSWYVSFDYGAVAYVIWTTSLYVRLVHDGQ